MKIKFALTVALSLTLSCSAFAGLTEAVNAFNKGDYATAYPEMLALSQEGDAKATYYLGLMYKDGLGVTKDSNKAISYLEQAERSNVSVASIQLAKMALAGEGLTQDATLGFDYLKKAAYAGSEDALYELGQMYENGTGTEVNYTYAFGFYYMGALKGDKRAQLKAGQFYLNGRGIPQDFAEAVKWYTRSSNQGYVPAQKEWADLRSTNARLKNPVDAYAWYSILAAYNSDEVGQEAVAKRDKIAATLQAPVLTAQQKKVMAWRPTSAMASVPLKERQNAILPIIPGFNDSETTKNRLSAGSGLNQDGTFYGITENMIERAITTNNRVTLEKAVEKSASQNVVKVYGYYGDLLRERFNDPTAAVSWYQKGADKNEGYAQYQLAKSYCEGRGVEQPDISVCYGWMLDAVKNVDSSLYLTVKSAMDTIEATATPQELEEGKKQYTERGLQTQQKEEKKPVGLFNLF